MGSRSEARLLALFVAASLVGCAQNSSTVSASAVEHEKHAEKLEKEAKVHEGYVRAAGSYAIRYVPAYQANADDARSHAALHRAAADTLRASMAQECVGIAPEAHDQCPMINVNRAEDTSDGVVLWLVDGADPVEAARQMNCHVAHARTEGGDMDECPFYVKGLSAARVPDVNAVRLTTTDPKALAALQTLIHDMAE